LAWVICALLGATGFGNFAAAQEDSFLGTERIRDISSFASGLDVLNESIGINKFSPISPLDGQVKLGLHSNQGLTLPLVSKETPRDADLRIWRFYIFARKWENRMIYSDNINRTESDAESGIVGISRLNTKIVLALTDSINIHTDASLVFLPFSGEIGINGLLGIRKDSVAARFRSGPFFSS